jgi:hypothetical protein
VLEPVAMADSSFDQAEAWVALGQPTINKVTATFLNGIPNA